MLKKLISGLFWVFLLNLIVKPFWILGIEVGVQNAVGAEMYGFYFAIFNMAYIFNILLDIGVTNFNTRNISQHPNQIGKYFESILCIKFLLLGLYVLIAFSVALICGYSSRQFIFLAWLCLNQFLNSLILYMRSNFEGLLLFKWDSVLSVLDRLVMIVVCGLMLWGPWKGDFRIEWFIHAQTAAYVVTLAVASVVLFRKTGFRKPRLRLAFSLSIIKRSLPFALLVLLMASYNRIDPILLQHFAPNGSLQSGIYAGAFRLLDALSMISYLISVPLLPVYARLCKESNQPESREEIKTTTRILFSLTTVAVLPIACTLASLSMPLMEMLYTDNLESMAAVFSILIWGILPITFTYIFGTLLTANGNLKTLNILSVTTLIINIAVNLLLIPKMGAEGSAFASLTAQSFIAIAQITIAARIFKIGLNVKYILKLTLFTLFIIVCNRQLNHAVTAGAMEWWVQIALMAVAALLAGWLLKLINVKEINLRINTEK